MPGLPDFVQVEVDAALTTAARLFAGERVSITLDGTMPTTDHDAPPAGANLYFAFWTLPPAERNARVAELNTMSKEQQRQPGIEVMYEGKQPPLYYAFASVVLRPFQETALVDRELVLRLFGVLL